jgi:hypothetical protein
MMMMMMMMMMQWLLMSTRLNKTLTYLTHYPVSQTQWIYTTCVVHRNVFSSIYAKSLLMTTISIQLKVLNPHQAESITHIPQNISLPSQSQKSRRVGAQFWQFVIHFLFAIACILILCYSTPSAKSYTKSYT